MRLAPRQRDQILSLIRDQAGQGTDVWLYGSRLDDTARGGDVDLLIQPEKPLAYLQQAALHAELEQTLRLPVDLSFVDRCHGPSHFQRSVRAAAVRLEQPG